MEDIGKLKELQLDLVDEINCISILKSIQNATSSNSLNHSNQKNSDKQIKQENLLEILTNSIKKKRRLKSEIIIITKEIFKLDFSIEENSKIFIF